MKKITTLTLLSTFFYFLLANNPLSKVTLYYDTDEFALTEEQQGLISQQISQLEAQKGMYYVEINGHTDNEGSRAYNQILSRKRALWIQSFFINQEFPKQHVFISSNDFSKPQASNDNEDGKQLNRRVEVNIYQANSKITQIGDHTLNEETLTINNNEENEVVFKSGVKLSIPANSFVDVNGKEIEGSIELKHTSMENFKDFILSDIPMSFLNENQEYFSSAGMFELNAVQNQEELQLAKNASLDIEMPATSLEIETQFFEYNRETDKWAEVQTELRKNLELETFYDTIARNKYNTKKECLGYEFNHYKLYDTTYFNIADAHLREHPIKNEKVMEEASLRVAIENKENRLFHWKKKSAYYDSYPALAFDTLSNGMIEVKFTTKISRNLSASELKNLSYIKVFADETSMRELSELKNLQNITVEKVHKNTISLIFTQANQETVFMSFETGAKGSKARYKKLKKHLKENFESDLLAREQLLETAKDKVIIVEMELNDLNDNLVLNLSQQTPSDIAHRSILSELILQLSRYKIGKQKWEDYNRTHTGFLEVDKWLLANANNDKGVLQLLNQTRNSLYCSSAELSWEIVGTEQVVKTYQKTKAAKASQDLSYAFKLNKLGVYNVDRLKGKENALIVDTDKYVNENGEQVFVCNMFLSGSSFNGAINYNGLNGYTPYHFLVNKNESYGIIAIDIYGKTYMMGSKNFDKTIAKSRKNCVLKLQSIDAKDDVQLFAAI